MANVVVIGSGISGIAASVRLACIGHKVSVFESNAYAGGKLTQIEGNGFRFDAGPSLFTMPELVTELFEIAGKDYKDYFQYSSLDVSCNYFYEDGTVFKASTQEDKLIDDIVKTFDEVDEYALKKYLHQAAGRFETTKPIFIEQSLHKWKNYFTKEVWKGVVKLPSLGIYGTMHQENAKYFKDERLVQLFDRYATYNGSNPYQSPAIMNMIQHVEHGRGTFFPVKGMHSITQCLYALASELGVKFYFNSQVAQIKLDKNKVSGVVANETIHECDVVVCNADIYTVYHRLLSGVRKPQKILNQEKSSSALIFYWGVNKTFEQLGLHNIFFSKDYLKEFNAIFRDKNFFDDPTVYINITSKHLPSDAPKGCENWFVMVNVPNLSGNDSSKMIVQYKQTIFNKLNRILNTSLQDEIVYEKMLTPVDIEAKTSSHLGALYGNASNNRMAAFYRHKNFSSDIKGLYFCGGSVHPGGGIPLCLNSAKIVSQLINEDGY